MTNLLTNGRFIEGATHSYVEWNHPVPEIQIPYGWTLFNYNHRKTGDLAWVWHRPECKLAMVRGQKVWKAFTSFATHRYALGQEVLVTPGATYRLTVKVNTWSCTNDDETKYDGGSYRTKVGINPMGYTDWASRDIVWSTQYEVGTKHDGLGEEIRTITTKAVGDVIIVWLLGDAEWAVRHNDAYWIEAVLEEIAGPPAEGHIQDALNALEGRLHNVEDRLEYLERAFLIRGDRG